MTPDGSPYLDRYTAGDLTREEERELARAALRDPDLFDALMGESAARAALRLEGVQEPPRRATFNSARRWVAGGAVAAAAVAVAFVYPALRQLTRAPARQPQTAAQPTLPRSPAAAPDASPIVLTARLEDLNGASNARFRSSGEPSRAPAGEGVITSSGNGAAVLAVGSIDGVVQGIDLDVYRGGDRRTPVGRVRVETVFRESSRGRITGDVRAGDTAAIPGRLMVAALRQRVVSLMSAGQTAEARDAAERAIPMFGDPQVTAGDRRVVLAALGAIERRAGESDRAVEHLRAAAGLLDHPLSARPFERTATLTELGAALLAIHRPNEADRVLRDARTTASGDASVWVLNDLGAAAALRGDRAAASEFYRSALTAAGGAAALEDARLAIGKNLAALSESR